MCHEIISDAENEIVLVKISGYLELEGHKKIRKESYELCKKNGWNRILADLTGLKTKSNMSYACYDFGSSYYSESGQIMKIANVLPKDKNAKESTEYVSTVASNKGFIVENFNDIETAKKWLLKSK